MSGFKQIKLSPKNGADVMIMFMGPLVVRSTEKKPYASSTTFRAPPAIFNGIALEDVIVHEKTASSPPQTTVLLAFKEVTVFKMFNLDVESLHIGGIYKVSGLMSQSWTNQATGKTFHSLMASSLTAVSDTLDEYLKAVSFDKIALSMKDVCTKDQAFDADKPVGDLFVVKLQPQIQGSNCFLHQPIRTLYGQIPNWNNPKLDEQCIAWKEKGGVSIPGLVGGAYGVNCNLRIALRQKKQENDVKRILLMTRLYKESFWRLQTSDDEWISGLGIVFAPNLQGNLICTPQREKTAAMKQGGSSTSSSSSSSSACLELNIGGKMVSMAQREKTEAIGTEEEAEYGPDGILQATAFLDLNVAETVKSAGVRISAKAAMHLYTAHHNNTGKFELSSVNAVNLLRCEDVRAKKWLVREEMAFYVVMNHTWTPWELTEVEKGNVGCVPSLMALYAMVDDSKFAPGQELPTLLDMLSDLKRKMMDAEKLLEEKKKLRCE